MKKLSSILTLTIAICITSCVGNAKGEYLPIKNNQFWNTVDGQPIYSQGGGIFKFPDPQTGEEKYYWYGVHYREAELYREDPSVTHQRNHFMGVTCYSSTDFVNWTSEGHVLTPEEVNKNGWPTWVGRMGVAYLPEIKKYALLVQHGQNVLICLGDSPTGQFTQHRHIDMTDRIGTPNTGDQTVFTDEDTGKSYLIYSYGRGRNKIYVSEIGVKDGMVDLLDCVQIFKGESREGNCLFKYKGRYYMCASNIYGWDCSFAYYLVADNIYGPYTPTNDMQVMPGCEQDFAHVTQTGFFYTIKGTKQDLVLYCGDRWAEFAGNGLGYNQWLPLTFEGEENTPRFNSVSNWELNATTGEWRVGADNNYILNPSFEADRNAIPSNRKPVQLQLMAWTSEVITGNKIANFDPHSPQLNYFNTQEDRKVVVGEKALCITDTIPFIRNVYQWVKSRPNIPLEKGIYTVRAMVRTEGEIKATLCIGGETLSIPNTCGKWQEVALEVEVAGNKIPLIFHVDGKADSRLLVDDVEMKWNREGTLDRDTPIHLEGDIIGLDNEDSLTL